MSMNYLKFEGVAIINNQITVKSGVLPNFMHTILIIKTKYTYFTHLKRITTQN